MEKNSFEFNYEEALYQLLEHHTNENKDLIKKAYNFAIKSHYGQKRKSGEDYVQHPINVALILANYNADAMTICAALLHDVVEDTTTTLDEIKNIFNEEIAILVDGVTKVKSDKNVSKIQSNIQTINKLITSLEVDPRIIIIKLADRLHNMLTIDGHKEEKRVKVAKETLDVYTPIASLIGLYDIKRKLEYISFKTIYPEDYNKISEYKRGDFNSNEDLIELIFNLKYSALSIKNILEKENVKVENIMFNHKSSYGIFEETRNGKININQIKDLMTFEIIVDDVSDVYNALRIINNNFPCINMDGFRIKDYISNPKNNNYQGIHSYNIVNGEQNSYLFQFQIRTNSMQRRALLGLASLWDFDNVDAKKLMADSLSTDFPFYQDLKNICLKYNDNNLDNDELYNKLNKMILTKRIYIRTSDFGYDQTYEGCTIHEFIEKKNINLDINEYNFYINETISVDENYVLKNNDYFTYKRKK